MAAFAPDEIVLLPLYPQFSTTTTGSSLKAWRKAYKGPGADAAVCCYPDEPGLVEAHAAPIRAGLGRARAGRRTCGCCSRAHGLPEQVIEGGDPYQWQVERTCAAVVAGRGLGRSSDWRVCYQSRVGPHGVDRALDAGGDRARRPRRARAC